MRRFIECLIPLTMCNLHCSYCYVTQYKWKKNVSANFIYSPDYIAKALSKERLGGISLISMTASGETFIAKELPYISLELLKQGHFINITTNGTLTYHIEKFIKITEGYHDHIRISFSLHYTELLRKNLIDVFFDNIKKVRDSGCSILLQINLVDEYVPYWNQIKQISKERIGAYPQVALTRKISNKSFEIFTKKMTRNQYFSKGNEMLSPLFEFTCKNFLLKQTEYCYAGYWSATLNLCTGEMTSCYGSGIKQNIYENITKPIIWEPIGKHCTHPYCINSSHFISQGIIPSQKDILSYGELRNREKANWYGEEVKHFLYGKFKDSNQQLNVVEKLYYELIHYMRTKHPGLRSKIKSRIPFLH